MISRGGQGYTIPEVMIFMAVSSLLFVAAMTAISGRQAQVQFTQAVRDFDTRLQDILNDVTTGYFPTSQSISCDGGTKPVTLFFGSSNEELGTSDDCIFIGKLIQFQPDNNSNNVLESTEESSLGVFSLAGNRYFSATGVAEDQVLADTIDEVDPVVVATTSVGASDVVEEVNLRYGLKIVRVIEVTDSSEKIEYGSIIIAGSLGGSSPQTEASQSQTVKIGGIKGSILGQSKSDLINVGDDIQTLRSDDDGYVHLNPKSGIIICMEDTGGRQASITLGSGAVAGTQLSIGEWEANCSI